MRQELLDARMILKSYEDILWKRVFQKAKINKIDISYYRYKDDNYVVNKDYIAFGIHDSEPIGYRSFHSIRLSNKEIEMSDSEFYDSLYETAEQKKIKEEKEKELMEKASRAIRKVQYEKLKAEFENE